MGSMSDEMDTALEREFVAKSRPCLKCQESFESSWAGERVCRRCKSNDGWRTGSMVAGEYPVVRNR